MCVDIVLHYDRIYVDIIRKYSFFTNFLKNSLIRDLEGFNNRRRLALPTHDRRGGARDNDHERSHIAFLLLYLSLRVLEAVTPLLCIQILFAFTP
jgi:hypothetical protein